MIQRDLRIILVSQVEVELQVWGVDEVLAEWQMELTGMETQVRAP